MRYATETHENPGLLLSIFEGSLPIGNNDKITDTSGITGCVPGFWATTVQVGRTLKTGGDSARPNANATSGGGSVQDEDLSVLVCPVVREGLSVHTQAREGRGEGERSTPKRMEAMTRNSFPRRMNTLATALLPPAHYRL